MDDIDPSLEWVEESHTTEFDPDFDIDELELVGIGLVPNPLVGARVSDNVAPGMENVSTSRATYSSSASASTITTTAVANVPIMFPSRLARKLRVYYWFVLSVC